MALIAPMRHNKPNIIYFIQNSIIVTVISRKESGLAYNASYMISKHHDWSFDSKYIPRFFVIL